jgi:hypothetical protein
VSLVALIAKEDSCAESGKTLEAAATPQRIAISAIET